jgi:hypothetical protein
MTASATAETTGLVLDLERKGLEVALAGVGRVAEFGVMGTMENA